MENSAALRLPGPGLYVAAVLVPAVLALISVDVFLAVYALAAMCGALLLLSRRFALVVFLVFALIAWFPEYSQTEDAWSAADFTSLYNYRPISWITASVFDYVFLLVVVLWLVRIILPGWRVLVQRPLAKEMLWFLGICMFSLLFGLAKGYPFYYALREFRVSAYFVLTFLMCLTSVDDEAKRRTLLRCLVGAAFLTGTYGVVRFALGLGKEYYGTLLVYYDIADSMVLYLGLFVLVSAWYAFRRKLIVLAVLAVPMVFSLLLSYRRGAWIACGFGFIFLMVLNPSSAKKRRGRARRWLISLLVGLLVVAVLGAAKNRTLFVERAESILDTTEDTSNVFRIMDALNALTTFARHPVFGIGFGGRYDLEYYSEAVAPDQFWDSVDRASHNGYLFILYKMGSVGFLIYMLLFWRFIKVWLQARRTIPRDGQVQVLLYACGSGAFSILVNNMTSPVSDSLRPALLLAICMAGVANLLPSKQVKRLHSEASSV